MYIIRSTGSFCFELQIDKYKLLLALKNLKVALIRAAVSPVLTRRKVSTSHCWLRSYLSDGSSAYRNLYKINTAVTFCYLWLFLTYKCCIYRAFLYMWWHLFLCRLLFRCDFVSNEYKLYFSKSHVHLEESVFILYGLAAILKFCFDVQVLFHLGKRVPFQTNLYSLTHTHSSRPYCIYVSVLYYMNLFTVF